MNLQPPKGMRDFLPKDMIKRESIISLIKQIFEKYGFDPFETPMVEYAETLEGKYGEDEKLIYKFKDKAGRNLALRYDLTVPLSRVIASNKELPKPFKRYQISRAWRYDNVQKGRYREIWQCDIDTVGSKSLLCEAELISAFIEILENLKFKKYSININNRKILDSIARYANVENKKIKDVFVSIDKFDKIGLQGVKKELESRKIKTDSVKKILSIITLADKPELLLNKLEKILGENEGINELREIISYLKQLKTKPKYAVNLTLARGLDYYTGPIFEVYVEEPKVGSLGGGGRYDNLIGNLSSSDNIPAVGFSLGLDRLIDVLNELKMIENKKTLTQVFISNVSEKNLKYTLSIVNLLRENNIKTQFDLMSKNLKKQLTFANSLEIPYVIIIGDDEVSSKKLKVKDMNSGKESNVTVNNLVKFFQK
ncbi:histidine--tRNA ligase [archaeon]|nr:histidine--tRNA ligase [archaeon]|tara:strand:- start:476 stop:1756 length:1281 start_codon:yes stop_codon:yes gene_type:complete